MLLGARAVLKTSLNTTKPRQSYSILLEMLNRTFLRSFHNTRRVFNLDKIHLTLFSKENCGLCTNAKSVLNNVLKDEKYKNKINLNILDIDLPENKEWWDKYCFDIPVLHIENETKPDSMTKIFHRMKEDEVKAKLESLQ